MRPSLLAAALSPLFLVACSARQPKIVNAPPLGISYRVENNDLSATNRRADHYCQEHEKRAHLESVDTSGAEPLAVYRCI